MQHVLSPEVSATVLRAVSLHQAGKLAEAGAQYREVLKSDPRQVDALHLLGVLAQQQHRADEALDYIQRAIAIDDSKWAFHSNLACVLQALRRPAEAAQSYERALRLSGESASLLSNLGTAYQELGRRAEAERCYRQALALDPRQAEAHYNLGNLLREAGRLDETLACYDAATALRPDYASAHANRAHVLEARARPEEAIEARRQALESEPGRIETRFQLAESLRALGRLDEALDQYDQLLALDPHHATAHFERGLLLLRKGKLARGWADFAWRWRQAQGPRLRKLAPPPWEGESLAGKTLLIHGEQGLENEVLFGSCLSDAIEQAEHCVIECDPRLVPLYVRSFPGATIHAREGWDDIDWLAQVRPIDYQAPIGNLPRYFRPELASFPRRERYLSVDPQRVAQWRRRYEMLGLGLKIGIAWRQHESRNGPQPPVRLAEWKRLVTLPGVHLVNLQLGDTAAELVEADRDWGVEIHDWEDADGRYDMEGFAARLAALDLIITAEHLTAHLAGAVGADVWTVLSPTASWYWMNEPAACPWFPQMRLFRETPACSRAQLVEEVRTAAADRAETRRPAEPIPAQRHGAPESAVDEAHEAARLKRRPILITDPRCQLPGVTVPAAFQQAMQAQQEGDLNRAEAVLRAILRYAPRQPDTLHRLGQLVRHQKQLEEAIQLYREAIAVSPAKPVFHFDLAVALLEAHRNEEAEAPLRKALELSPDMAVAYVNLGVLFERLGRLDEALGICQRAVKLLPNSEQGLYNLANVYLHQGSIGQAIEHYHRLLAVKPDYAKGHWNLGLTRLLSGDFARGWDGYQYRELAEQVKLEKFPLPLWDGSPPSGKAILIHAEQGVGDEIMFATCFAEVIAQARRTVITCDPRLEQLFARSFPGAEVVGVLRGPAFAWEPPPGIDVYTHAGTLPFFLRRSWESFPRQERFLVPEAALVAKWRERFDALGPGPKIGISWRAGGLSSEQRRRTSLLDHWQPLFTLPGAHFVNLQYGDWTHDLAAAKARWGVTIHHWPDADPLSDMENFAAQVAALDAVVSVGNTTVHVAGGLGVPTWTVLPRVPGWRYLLEGGWLPWYATVRLRRQRQNADWDVVFERVAREVREFFDHCAQPSAANDPAGVPAASAAGEAPVAPRLGHRCARPQAPAMAPASARDSTMDASPACGGCGATGCGSAPGTLPKEKIAEAFVGALKKHRAGHLAQAEAVYRQIVEIEPRHPDAWHLLGVLAHQTGRLPLAIECILKALEVAPDNGVFHYNLAGVLRDAGQKTQALDHLREAIRLAPLLAEAHLNLGILLHAQGNLAGAIASYERALAARPDYAEAHNNIGSALRDQGRFEQAVECYRRAIRHCPDYPDARLNLAAALRKSGRADEAPADCDQAQELAPPHGAAHAEGPPC